MIIAIAVGCSVIAVFGVLAVLQFDGEAISELDDLANNVIPFGGEAISELDDLANNVILFDCAKQFDKLQELDEERNPDGTIPDAVREISRESGDIFLENRCVSTLNQWKDSSQYQDKIKEVDWELLKVFEEKLHKDNP